MHCTELIPTYHYERLDRAGRHHSHWWGRKQVLKIVTKAVPGIVLFNWRKRQIVFFTSVNTISR